jgi:hypothetical protein
MLSGESTPPLPEEKFRIPHLQAGKNLSKVIKNEMGIQEKTQGKLIFGSRDLRGISIRFLKVKKAGVELPLLPHRQILRDQKPRGKRGSRGKKPEKGAKKKDASGS